VLLVDDSLVAGFDSVAAGFASEDLASEDGADSLAGLSDDEFPDDFDA
jgi:hypothetical protein